jgi:hypothetical protein
MAHRDKTQGFGFIYADIQTLLRQRGELAKMDQWEPIEPPVEAHTIQMQPAEIIPTPIGTAHQPDVEQIKANLDRLAKLHQKLHVMLDEINRMSSNKKSDN